MLRPATDAPAGGERFEPLLEHGNLVIEQILSGPGDGRRAYLQDQDEWVVVLAGAADMEVDGDPVELRPGEWVFLPAGVRHAVLRTAASTSWLAVHLHPA